MRFSKLYDVDDLPLGFISDNEIYHSISVSSVGFSDPNLIKIQLSTMTAVDLNNEVRIQTIARKYTQRKLKNLQRHIYFLLCSPLQLGGSSSKGRFPRSFLYITGFHNLAHFRVDASAKPKYNTKQ